MTINLTTLAKTKTASKFITKFLQTSIGKKFQKKMVISFVKKNAKCTQLRKSLSTVKDLKNFNKKCLGIRHFNVDDFETGKWVTDGLMSFQSLSGQMIKLPKRVKMAEKLGVSGNGFMGYDAKTDTLLIDKNLIAEAKKAAQANGETLSQFMRRFGNTPMDGTLNLIRGPYQPLFHELGHAAHAKCAQNYKYLSKLEELSARNLKDTGEVREFLSNPDIQKTAGKISKYAQESPNEFVAETYSMLIQKRQLPKDVMDLYRRYNGPIPDTVDNTTRTIASELISTAPKTIELTPTIVGGKLVLQS